MEHLDEVTVECDEGGFVLVASTDEGNYRWRVTGLEDEILAAVAPIREWAADREQHRREYQAASVEERELVLHGASALPRDGAELLRDLGDEERKRAREGGGR